MIVVAVVVVRVVQNGYKTLYCFVVDSRHATSGGKFQGGSPPPPIHWLLNLRVRMQQNFGQLSYDI